MLGLLGAAVFTHQQSHQLQASIKKHMASAATVSGSRQEMETLRERAADNLVQLNAIIAQERQRFPAGEKLAALTRTLPARTWLTNLSGDRAGRTLKIKAVYLINPDAPYDLPTKAWLAALKEDAHFREGLTRLDVGQSSRKRVGDAELFSFELVAAWQPSAETKR